MLHCNLWLLIKRTVFKFQDLNSKHVNGDDLQKLEQECECKLY